MWHRVIGIVGGLGPYAHLELERLILSEAAKRIPAPARDQDFPAWVVVSLPNTPDRTGSLIGDGQDPMPQLERAIRMLEGSADFALIACNTAHAYLEPLRKRTGFPIVDMVGETAAAASKIAGGGTIGLLATTGGLRSGIYPQGASRVGVEARFLSLLDLPDGERWQQELVMEAIYGPMQRNGQDMGGIKSGALENTEARTAIVDRLHSAARMLADNGARAIVLGCTEIPLAIGCGPSNGIPLIDPMQIAAKAAIAIAANEREPDYRLT